MVCGYRALQAFHGWSGMTRVRELARWALSSLSLALMMLTPLHAVMSHTFSKRFPHDMSYFHCVCYPTLHYCIIGEWLS